jgi:hypothetical protein
MSFETMMSDSSVKTGAGSIAALARNFRGEILEPGSALYEERRKIWNAAIDRHPMVIARPADARDVQTTVRWAVFNGFPLSVRSGGHGISGAATQDGAVMIDLGSMTEISVDVERNIVRAQTGALFHDLLQATHVYGMAVPSGKFGVIGVGGASLGGGIGWLARKYGMAIDHIESAEMVLASGELVRVSRDSYSDLFWAIRGGGGNFGVVTSIDFRMVPVATIFGGYIAFPFDQAKQVLRAYREMLPGMPDELTSVAVITTDPSGSKMIGLNGCFTGSQEAGEMAFKPFFDAGTPLVSQFGLMPYPVLLGILDSEIVPGVGSMWRTGNIDVLSDDLIDTIVDHYAPASYDHQTILIEHMGGAMGRIAPDATAFPHRQDELALSFDAGWREPEGEDSARGWVRNLWDAVQPFTNGNAYVGYLGSEGTARVRAAYGTNYERLSRIKAVYDPANVFRFNQNILPKEPTFVDPNS